MYEIRRVKEHVEVYLNGEFQFSGDTIYEAINDLGDGAVYYVD